MAPTTVYFMHVGSNPGQARSVLGAIEVIEIRILPDPRFPVVSFKSKNEKQNEPKNRPNLKRVSWRRTTITLAFTSQLSVTFCLIGSTFVVENSLQLACLVGRRTQLIN